MTTTSRLFKTVTDINTSEYKTEYKEKEVAVTYTYTDYKETAVTEVSPMTVDS